MYYPLLCCDKGKLADNTRKINTLCKEHNIMPIAVVKGTSAWHEVCECIVNSGITKLADSRMINLKAIQDINCEKILLRIPMKSEIQDVIKYTDISLNSELEMIKLLNQEAINQNKIHKIILMIDVGDLREGIWPTDVDSYANEIKKLSHIHLLGIGTNITCYGAVLPTDQNLGLLSQCADNLRSFHGMSLEIVSGGNSSSFNFMLQGNLPPTINNLRLGEVLLLGRETENCAYIPGLNSDVFTLQAQIIEIKEKPSIPIGRTGVDGFGNVPKFKDKGKRIRAIVAIGRQDVKPNTISPLDENIEILGASSDHMIIDITDSKTPYKLGDCIHFNVTYEALLDLCTSKYVFKKIMNTEE